MILYSEIIAKFKDKLADMGLADIESGYIQQYGDTVFQDHEVTDRLQAKILEGEIQLRTLRKSFLERQAQIDKIAKENSSKELFHFKLRQEVTKVFPASKIKDEFKGLYDSFVSTTINEIEKSERVILNDMGELTTQSSALQTHPENLSPLDRLLYDARVTRFRPEPNVEDVIRDIVNKQMTDNFFNYET